MMTLEGPPVLAVAMNFPSGSAATMICPGICSTIFRSVVGQISLPRATAPTSSKQCIMKEYDDKNLSLYRAALGCKQGATASVRPSSIFTVDELDGGH